MTQKTSKPAPLATGTGLGIAKATTARNPENSLSPLHKQPDFLPAAWLAARAGVAVETAKVFAELNRWGRA